MKTGRWMHMVLAVAAIAVVMVFAALAGCGGSDDGVGGLNLPAEIKLISNAADGTEGNGGSYYSSISADGRYVAFRSEAENLVAGDNNSYIDIFVRDLHSDTIKLISNAADGTQGDSSSYNPSISADGRYVAFYSYATNLVAGDTNGVTDILVRDLVANTITLISNAANGAEGNNHSYAPAISGDGRYVAFNSFATNLVAGDTNDVTDIFVRDLVGDTIKLISNAADGSESNGATTNSSISADGRYVAFESDATNLLAGDGNGFADIFVRDLVANTITLISNAADGSESNGTSTNSSISADGRYVAFESTATNLLAGDGNGFADIFVRDLVANTITLISNAADGGESNGTSTNSSISADGRYVTFESTATNLVAGDGNGFADIFVRDLVGDTITRISIAGDGTEGTGASSTPSISADGGYVAFESDATDLVDGNTNSYTDIFFTPVQW